MPHINLYFIYNKGIAFSMLSNSSHYIHSIIICINIIICAVIARCYKSTSHYSMVFYIGMALVLGGALGNIIDKVSMGMVVDFIDFYIKNWHFATFNVADSAVSIGAMIIIIDQMKHRSITDI